MCTPLHRPFHPNPSRPPPQALNLSHNRISDAGADAIAAALSCNCSLQQLDLRHCSISDKALVKLAHACSVATSLETLLLWGNGWGGGNGFGSAAAAAWREVLLGRPALRVDFESYVADGVPMVAHVADVAWDAMAC